MADISSSGSETYSSSSGSDSSRSSSSLGRHRHRSRQRRRDRSGSSRNQHRQHPQQHVDDINETAAIGASVRNAASASVVLPMSVIAPMPSSLEAGQSSSAETTAATGISVSTATAWPESLIINCCSSSAGCQQMQLLEQQSKQPTVTPSVAIAGTSGGCAGGSFPTGRPKYPLPDDSEYSSYESLLGQGGGGRASKPFCRICHLPGDEASSGGGAASVSGANNRLLLSPCRCSGTLQHVHPACLAKWIEASARIRRSLDPAAEAERRRRHRGGRRRNGRSPPRCELCNYEYRRRAKFSLAANGGWRMPRVSRGDRVLHLIFLLCLLVMTACAVITVMCFVRDRDRPVQQQQLVTSASSSSIASSASASPGAASEAASKQQPLPPQHPHQPPPTPLVLTGYEALTLVSGILFFLAFFTAMSVQIKSRHTVYKLIVKCYRMNITYSFLPYERSRDSQLA
ncbi:hypothetical protein BOX15_Mlig027107g1 [Macrostomum lignano]|uniref:RING-CH-type domain-containing protein n=1 Tax=Macrostomum lignano TaxID=282301 RepID=A0A267E327_9PLAT|nr:hypothetical protein BOX15_Mlig027107g2 [Macrostomum lignano]PAA55052.1 hypothetical protein BOX15_Mlig027107g1 [Macrostomum lignano]